MENVELIQKSFRIMHPLFSAYVVREVTSEHKEDWWQYIRNNVLSDHADELPMSGDWGELVGSLDMANSLRLFDRTWNEIFRKKLPLDYRTWSKELMGVRNKVAHVGTEDFSTDDTWRALDTAARLCEAFDDEAAEEIRALLRQCRYGSATGSMDVVHANVAPTEHTGNASSGILNTTMSGLPSWRDVIEPHPDVAAGRYKNAEFAADLAQVARGEGELEYRDPVEFFARTFVTNGMAGLLTQAIKRVAGMDGDPVIQLKTAFGGGKTHSMLAMYHLLRGKVSIDKIPAVKPVLDGIGVTELPKVNVAVLVGTAMNPAKPKRPSNMPGITINTIWGEMASQLAAAAGDLSLYDYVKDADKKGVSPGSEAIKNLFDACGPCLILMDELVAYAKKLYGVNGLPAGSFDNFISFIQEVTEAARASKNSLVVASIPESNIEIGGDAGQAALVQIEHTFGRMESIWKPVAANEGFEVVRRRLFLPCKNEELRDSICTQFSRMYIENGSDFPIETKEVDYRERMIACYPIHPEIFDRLYNDWSTLERFQRTRGVLRLMAAVIHELWMGRDSSAMIMPGSIPLDVQNVSYELTRHLHDDAWNSIVDNEVDGKKSVPYQKDQATPRYGHKMAARRVARCVFLGSAPTSRSQSVRGIEASRIRLGVVQPGESIPDFNDALGTLKNSLAYLYSNPSGDRFWYDTRPTLRKTVEDRATQFAESDVEYEIENRLRRMKKESFGGIHICPNSSMDVPDEQSARLVILRPQDCYRHTNAECSALSYVKDVVANHGSSPRRYRNMLVFVAPDCEAIKNASQEVRRYLAWSSVKDDSETLNLDAMQNKETETSLRKSNETVDLRLREAYCWLIVPFIDRMVNLSEVTWTATRLSGGTDSLPTKAMKKLAQNEDLISKWSAALLQMEMNDVLWKDSNHLAIKNLWDYLTTYCYLPRLLSYSVLEDAIKSGLNSPEYFAIAAGYDSDNDRYIDLRYNQFVSSISTSDMLVKTRIAKAQIEREEAERAERERQRVAAELEAQRLREQQREDNQNGSNSGASDDSERVTVSPTPVSGGGYTPEPVHPVNPVCPPIKPKEDPKPVRFFMSATLDNARLGRDVQRLYDEILCHLNGGDGCKLEVSLEVSAESSDGFDINIVRAVSENCRTLKVKDFGFDER